MGAIVARQNSEEYLGLTDHAFNRLLYFSSIALALTAAGLLGYASLLSWRIRQLSRATSEVVNSDGSLRTDFPVSTPPPTKSATCRANMPNYWIACANIPTIYARSVTNYRTSYAPPSP